MSMTLLQGILVGGFVLLHLFAGKLRFLHVIPRSRWLSAAGGASVAYVFMHLLPQLERAQAGISDQLEGMLAERAVHLLALAGLVTFYGLERAVRCSRQGRAQSRRGKTVSAGIFWLHIGSFAVYNIIVGYLLGRSEDQDVTELLLFFAAMALHFLVVDYALREDHKQAYHDAGRWVLVTAIAGGWSVSFVHQGGEHIAHMLFAFIAGAVIMNVMKEELPKERESRLWAFVAGAASYAALLLFL